MAIDGGSSRSDTTSAVDPGSTNDGVGVRDREAENKEAENNSLHRASFLIASRVA
jgi:hypothetical protein